MKYKIAAAAQQCPSLSLRECETPARSLNGEMTAVFREHHSSLLAFLTFKLGSPTEAGDIAQEAYARVLRHGLPRELKSARAYVFKTANNLAINRLLERRRKREHCMVDSQDAQLTSAHPTPEDDAQCRDRLRMLQAAVDELPAKCRRAFVLYKFEFLEYREIAERMDLTESMIRKYVLKALRHCRERCEDETPGGAGTSQ